MSIFEKLEIFFSKIAVNSVGRFSNGISLAQKEGFTSGKMLDYIYKNEPSGKFIVGKIIDKIYLNHPGWQDIRNRKKNLCLNIKDAIDMLLEQKGEVRICDVASGPARYIIDTLIDYKEKPVSAELRDIDKRWLLDAQELAKEKNITLEIKIADALDEKDFVFEKQPDIMVASGFYDWFNDRETVKKSMQLIFNALQDGGYFVFSIQSGHHALNLTNEIFKDFNNHQLKMVTWDMEIINSILAEIGFKVIKQRADEKNHYPVILAQK